MATHYMCSSLQHVLSSVSKALLKSSHSHYSYKPLGQTFDWYKSKHLHWLGWSSANLWNLRFCVHVLLLVYFFSSALCIKKIGERRGNSKCCCSIHSWFVPFSKCKHTRFFFFRTLFLFKYILLNKTGLLMMQLKVYSYRIYPKKSREVKFK